MQKNKLLFLLPYPPPYAGPEIIAKEIINSNTVKNRDDIIFINSNIRSSNATKGNFDLKGIIKFIVVYTKFIYALLKSYKVFMYLSSSKAGFLRDSVYILTCWMFQKKCITQYHGANFDNFYNNQNQYYQSWIRFTLSKLYKLLILGNFIRGNFIRKDFNNIYNGNIEVLGNGLKTKNYPPKQKYNMLPFTIFFMGHLIYSKGFYDLVDAYKILYKKYGNDIRFIFAGENVGFKKSTAEFLNGKYKKDFLKNGKEKNKEVQQFIKNCNKYNSDYPGFVSGEEKIKTFNKSSVFVLPSCTEGFSMSCLEAMACGLPVITTPVGAMPEVIEHKKNGIITKIGNYRKLAKDIEYFIQNRDEIERIGKYNAQYVRDNFDIEKIAEELIKILEK